MPERFSPAQPNYLRFVSTPTIDIEPKNSENRTFLAVFAVFVVIRLAPSDPTRSVADTVDVAPVRLAQGIIK